MYATTSAGYGLVGSLSCCAVEARATSLPAVPRMLWAPDTDGAGLHACRPLLNGDCDTKFARQKPPVRRYIWLQALRPRQRVTHKHARTLRSGQRPWSNKNTHPGCRPQRRPVCATHPACAATRQGRVNPRRRPGTSLARPAATAAATAAAAAAAPMHGPAGPRPAPRIPTSPLAPPSGA